MPVPVNAVDIQDASDGDTAIRVAVRFRPLTKKELSKAGPKTGGKRTLVSRHHHDGDQSSDGSGWDFVGGSSVAQAGVAKVQGQTLFSFDRVFRGGRSDAEPGSTTSQVYDATCRSVVDGLLNGIDGTILAYGQTGSGKTYTMQGPGATAVGQVGGSSDDDSDDGIVQMASKSLFAHVAAHSEREFLIRTSYVEVYNENVRDLLAQTSPPPNVAVREDPRSRGGVHIGAGEVVVTDHASLVETLYVGNAQRTVGTTDMNAQSSRSHAIFRVTVESRELTDAAENEGGGDDDDDAQSCAGSSVSSDDRAVLVSTLNLVDLAGSESVRGTGTSGTRQKEGGNINRSLLALSNVIHALSLPPSKRPKYINYRDSKLTRILQPSLSGNAQTAVLCCASPSPAYIEETRSTLKFASRAKLVQVHAKKNEVMDDRALIKRLQRELAAAKRALKAAAEQDRQHVAAADQSEKMSDMRQKLTKLESIILSPKRRGINLGGDAGQRQKMLDQASRPLAASLDPALWRKAHDDHRYSVVDMHLTGSLETLHLIEEDEDNENGSTGHPTSESDILLEALKAKNEANRKLNSEMERMKAEIESLQAEVKISKEESNAYKTKHDTLVETVHNLQSTSKDENVYGSDNDIDCLLPARRTFWEILFGGRQNLLECWKPAK